MRIRGVLGRAKLILFAESRALTRHGDKKAYLRIDVAKLRNAMMIADAV